MRFSPLGSMRHERLLLWPASVLCLLVVSVFVAMGGSPSQAAAPTAAGQLYSFGENFDGQLGSFTNNGTENANPTPMIVGLPGATGPVAQVAAGEFHSLALTSTGQLYAFGSNTYGQLGSTTNEENADANPTPTVVGLPGASGPVTQIAAGGWYSLALTSTGQLFAFGENAYGQLGNATNNGNGNANPTPMLVEPPWGQRPGDTDRSRRQPQPRGHCHRPAVCVRRNGYGQLGNTTNVGELGGADPTPTIVSLPGASGPVTQVAAGVRDSLALTSTGQHCTRLVITSTGNWEIQRSTALKA